MNFVSLIFISWFESVTMTAGFGMGTTFWTFFWNCVTQVNAENQGIILSIAYGKTIKLKEKNKQSKKKNLEVKKHDNDMEGRIWAEIRQTFARSLIWNFVITAVCCILYPNVYKLLTACNFDPDMSYQAQVM